MFHQNHEFSPIPGGSRHCSQPYKSVGHCSLSSFRMILSQVLSSFLTHMQWSVLWGTREGDPLHSSWVLSVCSSLFSDTRSCQLLPSWSPWTLSSIFATQGVFWDLSGSPCSVVRPGNSLKAESWGSCRICLVSCLSGIISCHCLVSSVLIYSVWFFHLVWVGVKTAC